jgi:hypothetical protein
LSKELSLFTFVAEAAVNAVSQFVFEIPAIATVWTHVNVFGLGRNPSVNVYVRVNRQTGLSKLTHLRIESASVARIQHAVVEPDVSHFMEQSVGEEGGLSREIVLVEFDLVFE